MNKEQLVISEKLKKAEDTLAWMEKEFVKEVDKMQKAMMKQREKIAKLHKELG